jgi:cytochrome c peroxidase
LYQGNGSSSTFHASSIASASRVLRQSPQLLLLRFSSSHLQGHCSRKEKNMPAHGNSPTPRNDFPAKQARAKRDIMSRPLRIASAVALLVATTAGIAFSDSVGLVIPKFQVFGDPDGAFATINVGGPTDTSTNPFFLDMGTNGRTCVTCHQPSDAFSITPPHLQQRFSATDGADPVFRPVDGATCPTADVSTVENRRDAYKLLLSRGLIRIFLAVPVNANYEVMNVSNPYGCNATDVISMYRRPLPTTNVSFLSAVMFDGRESTPVTGTTKIAYNNYPASLMSDLAHQSVDATVTHAQGDGTRPTSAEQQQIVNFEMQLFTAQLFDSRAGLLNRDGASGGPALLTTQPFFISINSSVHALVPALEQPGGLVTPGDGQFTPNIFNLYGAWPQQNGAYNDDFAEARQSVPRGEELFNSLQIPISGVAGINDDVAAGGLLAGGIPTLQGTCGTCHDTPNVGNHSFPTPLNIGTGDPSPSSPLVNLGGLDLSYLPQITVCQKDPTTGLPTNNCKTTTDLGQALIDGNFDHVGKIKGPILRGLAGRAPYFHNGSATTLMDVVNFYNTRFTLGLTDQQKGDLVAFLKTL